MKNNIVSPGKEDIENTIIPNAKVQFIAKEPDSEFIKNVAEVLFVTSYPPKECGIATYSRDLVKALNNKFNQSLSIRVCALENEDSKYIYSDEVKYVLNTFLYFGLSKMAATINSDSQIKMVLIQHELGFFSKQEHNFLKFLFELSKPVVVVFHTILPHPDEELKSIIKSIAAFCKSIIVMTHHSANILLNDYGLPLEKISVIAHGTHLVTHFSEEFLKLKYGLIGRKVLTTSGLLSSGKSIETTIDALPDIIKQCPDVMFLVIGKTHPEVGKLEGEKYRNSLEAKVKLLKLNHHVKFINNYLPLPVLLEYLQLTDIYLFTSNDPNQAVSGTLAYAMSCACPIISTPIPYAKENLKDDTGIIIDFCNSQQLADEAIKLLNDDSLRNNISSNALHKIVSSSWENSAVAHALLFEKVSDNKITVRYSLPPIKLDHLKLMTTNTGVIQFSKINQPDISSGYTLDDNARALVATCMYYKLTCKSECVYEIDKYLRFIKLCQQPSGNFLNYVDKNLKFTDQNSSANLEDSNGMAIWALGHVISLKNMLPAGIIMEAENIFHKSLQCLPMAHSTRAMAFAIKGLYQHQQSKKSSNLHLIMTFANRLVQMYRNESNGSWEWFESYLTYANSILPETMLYAWQLTGDTVYRDIAKLSLKFLLSQIFNEKGLEVISNKQRLQKGEKAGHYAEQPIEVAYTILTLSKFYDEFNDEEYKEKMHSAFNWFLGNNRLQQIVYNPCTGGCYDGLEETHVNLNQGAESTVSYLMARFTVEKYETSENRDL